MSSDSGLSNSLTGVVAAAGMVGVIIPMLYGLFYLLGIIKVIRYWDYFGSRSIGMLLVTLLIPFGFLWPFLAKTEQPATAMQQPMVNASSRSRSTKAKSRRR